MPRVAKHLDETFAVIEADSVEADPLLGDRREGAHRGGVVAGVQKLNLPRRNAGRIYNAIV